MTFWIYILRCSDGVLYTGHTDDLERRIGEHQTGGFCAFTERRRPVKLIYSCEFPSREEALTSERQIKGWSRAKKLALAHGGIETVISRSGNPSTSSGRT